MRAVTKPPRCVPIAMPRSSWRTPIWYFVELHSRTLLQLLAMTLILGVVLPAGGAPSSKIYTTPS
ncbi:hypothetical protein BDV19DRAFT_364827 [Aspergillus venezuelensis]